MSKIHVSKSSIKIHLSKSQLSERCYASNMRSTKICMSKKYSSRHG